MRSPFLVTGTLGMVPIILVPYFFNKYLIVLFFLRLSNLTAKAYDLTLLISYSFMNLRVPFFALLSILSK
jgi:hypothetical protein